MKNPVDPDSAGGPEKTAVGYCKPPVATRFKPGVSGNPTGRTKKKPTIGMALQEIYTKRMVVHEGPKTRQISRLEAALLKQLEQGLKGDQRAMRAAISNAKELGLFERSDWISSLNVKALTTQELHELRRMIIKMNPSLASRSIRPGPIA
jgi:Family of unknown function (DUF5681)